MERALRAKIIAGLAAVFLAGVCVGMGIAQIAER